jgi:hypothetical protein
MKRQQEKPAELPNCGSRAGNIPDKNTGKTLQIDEITPHFAQHLTP